MTADAPPTFDVGSVIDRYEIIHHVARGGMGSVWLARFARRDGMSKQVAIKTIAPEFAGNPQLHAMFLEEARISSKLVHPNVAQVLDVGEHGGSVYIVFEWIDGKSLDQLCRAHEARGDRLPLPVVLRGIADASAGLHAAHELKDDDGGPLGVVHRDVTPGNILVSEDGFAKVIDFGIAKSRDRLHGETRSGLVKGTPQYMSPEHACREPVDRRTDIWSLGAVMFRAIAGAPPFPDQEALLDYIDGAKPSPPLPSGTPPDVAAIVARALEVDRTRRFATAEEMRHAVERALHAAGVPGSDRAPVKHALTPAVAATAQLDPDAATELAVPSMPPRAAPAKRPRDPVAPLVVAVAVAGVLALGSAVLVFCGS